jgi:AraC family transcriptional regulator
LKREAEAPTAAFYAEALQVALAHELLRHNGGGAQSQSLFKGGLAARQKNRVAGYIGDHYAEDISLRTLAGIAGLSPFHFSRAFKASFGIPPHRYHMRTRIERAKALLARADISVTEVALKTGFRETSSFSSAFRKIALQSPTEYRRSLE